MGLTDRRATTDPRQGLDTRMIWSEAAQSYRVAMTRSRSFTGTVTAAVLVAAFGNPWVSDWIANQFKGDNVLSWLVHQLTWPSWSVDFAGTAAELRGVIASDVRAILTVVLVYVLLVSFRKTFPEGFAGFILGWATLIFAAAIAGLAAAFVAPDATIQGALNAAALGAVYGLFAGWLIGFITSVGRNIPFIGKTSERSKESAAA